MSFPPLVLLHIVTALGALVFGGIALTMKKGTTQHRIIGRLWVALMLTTALVSFGIKTHGHYSWIHLLSVVTLVAVSASLYAAVRGRIRAHQRGMRSMYIGLAVAGAFTLLPGRLLGDLVWQSVGLV